MTDMMRVPGDDQPQTRTDLAAVAADLDSMAATLRTASHRVFRSVECAALLAESARIHRRYAANQIRLKRDIDGMMADALSVAARTREKEDMAAFVRLRFLGDLLAIPDTPPEDRP